MSLALYSSRVRSSEVLGGEPSLVRSKVSTRRKRSRLSLLGVERETQLHHRRRVKRLDLFDALAVNHRRVGPLVESTSKLLVVANELNRAEFRLRLVLRLDHSGGQEAYFHGLAFQGEPEVLARKFYSVVRHVRSSPPNG